MHGAAPVSLHIASLDKTCCVQHLSLPPRRTLQPDPPQVPHAAEQQMSPSCTPGMPLLQKFAIYQRERSDDDGHGSRVLNIFHALMLSGHELMHAWIFPTIFQGKISRLRYPSGEARATRAQGTLLQKCDRPVAQRCESAALGVIRRGGG